MLPQARSILGTGRFPPATSRLFTSSSVVRAKAKTPTTKTKSGGFKLKKEQYTGARRITATKPSALSASQLTGHHLLQSPKRELSLPELTPETLTTRAIGTAVSLPSGPGTVTGTFGLPLSLEDEFSLLSSPTSVIRDITLSVINTLDKGGNLGTSSKDSRVVLIGDTGSGKSHLLLQAANYAAAKKWIVLYAPRVTSWVDSTTPYAYDARTRTFQQPELALQLLEQFVQANSEILRSSDTQIAKEIQNDRLGTFPQGTPLSNLLDVGLKDQSLATETLEVALRVLGEQTKHPVLLAIDDFQALFCMSKYRDPQYQLLFAHHLSIPRLILEYAAGMRVLARGAVLGAVSNTDARFLAPLPLKEALGMIEPGFVSPYERRNGDVLHYASGVKGLRVPSKMQIGEATSMFDIWVKNNALHTPATDSLFMAKFVEASGNPRELNGIRTLSQYHPWYTLKTCEEMLKELGADIICFQEMKISRQLLTKSLALPGNYDATMSFPKNKGGYSGVAVYTNKATVIPLKAEEGLAGGIQSTSKVQLDANQRISVTYPEASTLELMPDELGNLPSDFVDLDSEGRALVVDFGLFVLINVYCPNQTSEERLPFKFNFHKLLEDRVRKLIGEGREVIVLGDLNVVAAPVDHCEGSLESKKNTFWEPPVRAWFRDWLDPEGPMVDVVRRAWSEREQMFTCWDTRTNARESNYGTRIDYILLTKGLLPWFKHGDIQPDIRGSDHCPVFVDLHDEIALPDGRISRLVDVLGPLLDSEGKYRDPPPISTKYWDEYSGKQKLLSTFFTKKSVLPVPELAPAVTEPLDGKSTCQQEGLGSNPASLSPLVMQENPSVPAQNNIPSPKPEGRKRKTASSTAEISSMDSKKSKKSQVATRGSKQHKLSTFFPGSQGSSAKQPSSPPIELLDSEDEVDLPQTAEAHSPVGISTTLPASQAKDGKSSKDAWSQLMRPIEAPNCTVHDVPTKEFTANKPGPNKGKRFFVCSMPIGPGYDSGKSTRLREEVDPRYRCNYFKWASDVKRETKHGG